MPVSQAVLVQCALFAPLGAVTLGTIAERMHLVPLRRREVLGGASGFKGLGVVLSGSVQTVEETADGREVVLSTATANQAFGLEELLAGRRVRSTVIAAVNGTTVGTLDQEAALDQIRRPEVALATARTLAQKLCEVQAMQKLLAIHSVPARVAGWLAWQSAEYGLRLSLPTHSELAWQLNTSRESITRILQRLAADGLITRDGDHWVVCSPSSLNTWGLS